MLHFVMFYTVCKRKKIFGQKIHFIRRLYNLTPLDMHNILFQVYRIVSNQKEDSISIRKVKAYAIFNPLTFFCLSI